jgi:hypothetical protein
MTASAADARYGGWRSGWAYAGWGLGASGAFAGGVVGATVGPYGDAQYLPYDYYYGGLRPRTYLPSNVYPPLVNAPVYGCGC